MMNIFVLSTSFCVISVVNAGLLGLSYDEGPQHVIDLSSVTSALTGGLQKVLDVIKSPKPVTIEIYSQERPFPNPPYVGENTPHRYPPPDPYHHPHQPPHQPPHFPPQQPPYQPPHQPPHQPPQFPPHQPPHHHHHGHGPPNPYPDPPPMEYPPNYPYPFRGTDNHYPDGQRYDGMNGPYHNYYADGSGQSGQQYGQNGVSYPGTYDQQYGEMEGQNDNESGANVSKSESQDTAEIHIPVSDSQSETGIDGYIDGFPVILLNENEIR